MESERVASSLRRHGAQLSNLRSIDVFGEGSRAGDEKSFDVVEDSICAVTAPGGPMRVDEQDPPTEPEVPHHPAAPQSNQAAALPDPLAEARLDFRIDRATAQSYLVKAGEYVQILDIEGRQCSDFQVFPLAQLDRGIERCLDMTTTRTLMGAGYPGPGLFAKYYDQDMRPLVEIVQDTCGRHAALPFCARHTAGCLLPRHRTPAACAALSCSKARNRPNPCSDPGCRAETRPAIRFPRIRPLPAA